MKTTKHLILMTVFLSQLANAADTATYYRVWQGFRKTSVSPSDFLNQLPIFMNSTLKVYSDKLNNYMVAVPPAQKPSFVPDELALVAVRSEKDYLEMKATKAGQAYTESHWDLFEKEISKSAPYSHYYPAKPAALEHNKGYDVVGKPLDWRKGHTGFFIGTRKQNVSVSKFLARLSTHLDQVSSRMQPRGLRGYIVIANDNYEIAYMNWASKEVMQEALKTKDGEWIQKDAGDIMDILQWTDSETFDGQKIDEGHFYSTIQ